MNTAFIRILHNAIEGNTMKLMMLTGIIFLGTPERRRKMKEVKIVEKTVKTGLSMGSCLAMILSWHSNQSILWAILHGIFSWFYVIYWAFFR